VRNLIIAALLAAVAPFAIAQRSGSHFSPSRFSQAGFGHRSPHATPHSFFDGLGLFSDPYYADALAQAYPAPQSAAFLMQPPQNPVRMPEQFPPSAQPLLIELQGNTYVRVSGPEGIPSEILRADAPRQESTPLLVASNPARSQANRDLAPVTLIFRDGHRDQVSDYTIANGILYTRANLYTDGTWTKKIDLAALNLPETLKQNQSPTAQFRLPAAPNEVITRP
jgi:hypothetical protein